MFVQANEMTDNRKDTHLLRNLSIFCQLKIHIILVWPLVSIFCNKFTTVNYTITTVCFHINHFHPSIIFVKKAGVYQNGGTFWFPLSIRIHIFTRANNNNF
jgi:hypothetical protein